jgi:hypothetical protein
MSSKGHSQVQPAETGAAFHACLTSRLGINPTAWATSRARYDLRWLRLRALIERALGTDRCRITDTGVRLAVHRASTTDSSHATLQRVEPPANTHTAPRAVRAYDSALDH